MATAAPTKTQIRALYSSFIRTSRSFASYNFRTYFIRNSQEKFRAHLQEKDPQRVTELYNQALQDLALLKRAAVVNRLYEGPKLVVEKPRIIVGGGGAGMEASAGGGGQPV
ncbi:hypothetical protein FRC04_007965 [Tulasnella sp. 424]|nr:hypothetical protein FRC04_007965 [Tulasnella sp. 424]KAG8974826.1 hypothetical protein FRC05_006758 [Tulasnella sp. 425]